MARLGHLRGWAIALAMAALTGTTGAQAQSSPDPSAAAPSLDPALTAQLIAEVPAHLRDSCMAGSAASDGAVASAQCLDEQGSLVLYLRYADTPSLLAAYDQVASLAGLAPSTGTTCGEGAFEGEYASPDGAVLGRLVCQTGVDGVIAAWTEDAHLVLGVIQVPVGDFGSLLAAWQSARIGAGPAPVAVPTPSAGPTVGPAASPGGSAAPQATGAPGATAAPGATIRQWASSATASSAYGTDSWGATQATGQPDTPEYGDYATAWAPSASEGGIEWLELGYDMTVIPTEVAIWETSGNGFVTRVEAWDEAASAWVTLWEGQDQSPQFVVGFSPDLSPVDFATDRLRISIDTAVPGWNEVDAVMLGGTVPEA